VERFLQENRRSFVVTMIGRDDPIKNFDLAFESFRLFLASTTGIAIIIVGVDPADDRINRLRTVSAGKMLALSLHDNPAAILNRSHIVLLTSRKEASSLVALESFCLGKPVVGTNVAGIRDVVMDRQTGVLCEQNPDSIVKALRELKEDTTLYANLSMNAQKTGDRMDVDAWAREYLDLYVGRRE